MKRRYKKRIHPLSEEARNAIAREAAERREAERRTQQQFLFGLLAAEARRRARGRSTLVLPMLKVLLNRAGLQLVAQ